MKKENKIEDKIENKIENKAGRAAAQGELLCVRDLHKRYAVENSRTMKREYTEVIQEISLTVRANESVCIMGRSGCGKTTLLKILGGLLAPTAGSVYYKGENLFRYRQKRMEEYRRTQVGFVFQDYKLLDHLTVRDNMILPLMLEHKDVEAAVRKVEEMADRLQIAGRLEYYPGELSGGEKQRAAIGRALMNDPELILADEPTGNLDEASGRIVMELLTGLQKELHKTLILVTHDKEIADHCDRTIMIRDGRIS